MASESKVLFYFYHEFIPGQLWVDKKGRFVNVIHENDANWTSHLDFVVKAFGGKVVELDGYAILDSDEEEGTWHNVTNEEMKEHDFEALAELLVERNKKAIKKAIKEALDG